ncbi:MAG: hypothetical protein ABIQ51_08165 [Mesorhizobium sp.]
MWKITKRLLHIADKGVDRFGYWAGFYIVVSGIWAWLVKHSSWVPPMNWADAGLIGIAATTALTVVLSLAAVSWRYFHPLLPALAEPKALDIKPIHSSDPFAEALDKPAYNEILAFCLDTLLPACHGIAELQELVIKAKCEDMEIAWLATSGLHSQLSDTYSFYKNYGALSGGIASSPGPDITFEAMLDYIDELEKGAYRDNYLQFVKMISTIEIDQSHQKAIREAWERFRVSHNRLLAEYHNIKRDIRFGKLLRPARKSRWGDTIEPIPPVEGIPFLSLLSTEGKTHP